MCLRLAGNRQQAATGGWALAPGGQHAMDGRAAGRQQAKGMLACAVPVAAVAIASSGGGRFQALAAQLCRAST